MNAYEAFRTVPDPEDMLKNLYSCFDYYIYDSGKNKLAEELRPKMPGWFSG